MVFLTLLLCFLICDFEFMLCFFRFASVFLSLTLFSVSPQCIFTWYCVLLCFGQIYYRVLVLLLRVLFYSCVFSFVVVFLILLLSLLSCCCVLVLALYLWFATVFEFCGRVFWLSGVFLVFLSVLLLFLLIWLCFKCVKFAVFFSFLLALFLHCIDRTPIQISQGITQILFE